MKRYKKLKGNSFYKFDWLENFMLPSKIKELNCNVNKYKNSENEPKLFPIYYLNF